MKLKELIEMSKKAEDYATEKHKKQKRRFTKEPYVEHPKRVSKIVRDIMGEYDDKEALIDAALLHDTIEDTDTTEEDLKKLFGGLIASLVKELTSDKEEIKKQGKGPYLIGKMVKMSEPALMIKLADRLDNVSDFNTAHPKFVKKYRKETEHIVGRLLADRKNLKPVHIRLLNAIIKKMDEVPDISEN